MSQHDLDIANQTRTAARADITAALQALASLSKGPAAPATPYQGQLWLDDDTPSAAVWTLKQYDGADWITWCTVDTSNNRITVPADNLPAGTVVGRAYDDYTTHAALVALVPGDDTVPQVGEGTEILSVAITPVRAADRVRVRVAIWGQLASASDYAILSVFRNGGANAIKTVAGLQGNLVNGLELEFEDSPASAAAQTYSVRVGGVIGALYLNGSTSGRLFGGASSCTLVLEDVLQ